MTLFAFIREKIILKSKIEKDFEILRGNSFKHSEKKNELISKKKEIYSKRKGLQILNFAMFFVSTSFIIQLVFGNHKPFFGIYALVIVASVRYINSGEISYDLKNLSEPSGFQGKAERALLLFMINLHKKPPLLISILYLFITGFGLLFLYFIVSPLAEQLHR
jgi:hypothetical protein